MTYDSPEDLDTNTVLYGVRITPTGLEIQQATYRRCPECNGNVTHYGGGLWMCGGCDWQI